MGTSSHRTGTGLSASARMSALPPRKSWFEAGPPLRLRAAVAAAAPAAGAFLCGRIDARRSPSQPRTRRVSPTGSVLRPGSTYGAARGTPSCSCTVMWNGEPSSTRTGPCQGSPSVGAVSRVVTRSEFALGVSQHLLVSRPIEDERFPWDVNGPLVIRGIAVLHEAECAPRHRLVGHVDLGDHRSAPEITALGTDEELAVVLAEARIGLHRCPSQHVNRLAHEPRRPVPAQGRHSVAGLGNPFPEASTINGEIQEVSRPRRRPALTIRALARRLHERQNVSSLSLHHTIITAASGRSEYGPLPPRLLFRNAGDASSGLGYGSEYCDWASLTQ